jgi:hypothetical protein
LRLCLRIEAEPRTIFKRENAVFNCGSSVNAWSRQSQYARGAVFDFRIARAEDFSNCNRNHQRYGWCVNRDPRSPVGGRDATLPQGIGQRAALLHEQEVVVPPLWRLSTSAARLQPSSAGPLTLVVAHLPFATSPFLRPCTIGASISKESRLTVYIDKTASAKIPRGRTVGRRTKQPRRCSIKTRSGDRPLDRQNKAVAARWGFFNQNTIANAIRLRAALNSNASR